MSTAKRVVNRWLKIGQGEGGSLKELSLRIVFQSSNMENNWFEEFIPISAIFSPISLINKKLFSLSVLYIRFHIRSKLKKLLHASHL